MTPRTERRKAERARRKLFRKLGRDHPEVVGAIRRNAERKQRASAAHFGRVHQGAVMDLRTAAPGALARLRACFYDEAVMVRAADEAERAGARFLVYAMPVEWAGLTFAAWGHSYAEARAAALLLSETACASGTRAVWWDFALDGSAEAEAFEADLAAVMAARMATRGSA